MKKALLTLGISAIVLSGTACDMDPAYKQSELDMRVYNEAMKTVSKAGKDYINYKEEQFIDENAAREKAFKNETELTEYIEQKSEDDYYTAPTLADDQLDEHGLGNSILEAQTVAEHQIVMLKEAADVLRNLATGKQVGTPEDNMPDTTAERQPSMVIASARAYNNTMDMMARIRAEQASQAWTISFGYRVQGMDNSLNKVYDILTQANYLRNIDYSPSLAEMDKTLAEAKSNKAEAEAEKQQLSTEIQTRTQSAAENNQKREENLEEAGKLDRESFTKRGPEALALTEKANEKNKEAVSRMDKAQRDKAHASIASVKLREVEAKFAEEDKLITNLTKVRDSLSEADRQKTQLVKDNEANAKKTTELFIAHFKQWNLIIDHQVNDRFNLATEDLRSGINLLKSIESKLNQNDYTRSQIVNVKMELSHSHFTLANTLLHQADINILYMDFLKKALKDLAEPLDNATKDEIAARIKSLELESRKLIDEALAHSDTSEKIAMDGVKVTKESNRLSGFRDDNSENQEAMRLKMESLMRTIIANKEQIKIRDNLLPAVVDDSGDNS